MSFTKMWTRPRLIRFDYTKSFAEAAIYNSMADGD